MKRYLVGLGIMGMFTFIYLWHGKDIVMSIAIILLAALAFLDGWMSREDHDRRGDGNG